MSHWGQKHRLCTLAHVWRTILHTWPAVNHLPQASLYANFVLKRIPHVPVMHVMFMGPVLWLYHLLCVPDFSMGNMMRV